ncbi:Stp1/IreP family PP2C-type Ser/Thr phosphatase [Alkalicoccobacillus porphyridii]|uniref:protein-serine/threonine phosphatase n=1 Tax=Alkalicoccobacillus porphyridii TaxID=2597270 RepID=A0A553ZY43_9BACI|nr:Stp1/IreP family PP2C-type Ser/Thr phosphatase [Alkalicoccobacillus porphyridii]TSB46362.1 Stp1/IreP family PP2C-type Ser/Thr phosphatase [Alkalicoccobacillus porphyridii]
MTANLDYVFQSDVGQVRSHNEDSGGTYATEAGLLAFVADGMGGHRAGDVASAMTSRLLKEAWMELETPLAATEAESWLRQQFKDINQAVHEHANNHEECQGMGTTLVAAICTDEYVAIGHIGDSRAYLRTDEGFSLKTADHSLVEELRRTGQISEEEAENHPRKNVLLRALGTEPSVKMDVTTLPLDGACDLLLCSDGLSDKISLPEINDILLSKDTAESVSQSLIQLANERGGEDNISIALVRLYSSMDRTG